MGLAWTAMGGEILFVEETKMPGSGELVLTGQLGEPERGMERERDGNKNLKAEWSYIAGREGGRERESTVES